MTTDEQTNIHKHAENASRAIIATATTMNILVCMMTDDEPKMRLLQDAIEQLTPATEHLSSIYIELNKNDATSHPYEADDNRN
tara:strand:- start:86 stop:334 length:249 start_codon:yes stop_codon:yes gene_type:complete